MSLLDLFRKKKTADQPVPPAAVLAAASGRVIPMADIPDKAFSDGVMGWCCGIEPTEGVVYAPVTGRIMQVADTFHALGVDGENGAQIILHVGLDTVAMRGKGFKALVREGQPVKAGDPLIRFDMEQIHAAGHPATIIMALLNTDHFTAVAAAADGEVKVGDPVFMAIK